MKRRNGNIGGAGGGNVTVRVVPLHEAQQAIYNQLGPRNLLRCGRRFGKTTLLETTYGRAATTGKKVGWFANEYKLLRPSFVNLRKALLPLIRHASRNEMIIELHGGGAIEFWTLDNPDAGRSRAYDHVVIDEGSLKTTGLEAIVEQAIMPTLIDTDGTITLAGTPKGVDPESYFYRAATDKSLGYAEFYAPTWRNPNLNQDAVARLKSDHPPLVYQQEFCAEFVDWSGQAFFSLDSLTVNGEPVPEPQICDGVFLVIDTATKTGRENDGTAALWLAYTRWPTPHVVLLDYDIVQIEGSLLEAWLPTAIETGKVWGTKCRARSGFLGAFIEDAASGTILLQQARRRGLPAQAINSKLTMLGKDERAINVSGYVYRGWVKFGVHCFNKVVTYKGDSANHLRRQVIGYRVGNRDQKEDDCLDCFCYGVAILCGDAAGF
jgi:hypothetical protein